MYINANTQLHIRVVIFLRRKFSVFSIFFFELHSGPNLVFYVTTIYFINYAKNKFLTILNTQISYARLVAQRFFLSYFDTKEI